MNSEATTLSTGAKVGVKLHGEQNVILLFQDHPGTEPLLWGFQTVADFRSFLKALTRFDQALGKVTT